MKDKNEIVNIICKAIAIGMGLAVIVLNLLNELSIKDGLSMLGIGLTAISIYLIKK